MPNFIFTELREPLTGALQRLCAKDEALKPFVVAQQVGYQDVFVQWCTVRGKLLFDVPWAKIVGEPMEIDASITKAIEVLRSVGMCDDDRVIVIEDDHSGGYSDGERNKHLLRLYGRLGFINY